MPREGNLDTTQVQLSVERWGPSGAVGGFTAQLQDQGMPHPAAGGPTRAALQDMAACRFS